MNYHIVKAIFWDNDGVLVNTERLYYRATKEILARVGVELTPEVFVEFFLTQSSGAWHLAKKRGISQDEVDALRAERNEIYGRLLREEPIQIPGVERTIARLRDHFIMGVVTSSRRDHFEIIHQSTNLVPYFDFVLTREDYLESKPRPDPYLRALDCVDVQKHECLVVEDSERGLAAAKSAELTCWVVPNELTKSCNFRGADSVLSDITDVSARLLGEDPG
ncbi:MAG: HAD-IA family hydrolase [Proteobacteria bacterium]|nr:HAD-IA family hydrolase [Pseudomonadota bacterium]